VLCISIAIFTLCTVLIIDQYQRMLERTYFAEIGISEYLLGLEAVEINYGNQIDTEAKKYGLNPEFLKALCMLECGGRKKVPSRYEAHIFRRLKSVKSGSKPEYGEIKHYQIKMISDEAIKNLASSWGPFQLMGLTSIQLGCNVADLRGKHGVSFAVQWIDLEYGELIKQGEFKDAFHKHNTGQKYPLLGPPRTHDPNYVNLGLRFMDYFNHTKIK
jgi:hypothetical protein